MPSCTSVLQSYSIVWVCISCSTTAFIRAQDEQFRSEDTDFFFPFVYFCIVLCLIYSTLVEDCAEESVPGTHLILTVTIFEHISNRNKLLFNPPVWDGKVLSPADRDERRHWATFSVQYREKMPSARKVSGSFRLHSNTLIHQVISLHGGLDHYTSCSFCD